MGGATTSVPPGRVRILVATDDALLGRKLAERLSWCDDFEVVGFARTEGDALTLNGELEPDIVVMDGRLNESPRNTKVMPMLLMRPGPQRQLRVVASIHRQHAATLIDMLTAFCLPARDARRALGRELT